MLLPLPLLVLVAAARLSLAQFPFDSRNISESAWACNASAASVTLQFAGPPIARICGAEVPQPATAALPTLTLSGYAPPAGNATVTVLIVDRDAPSAAQPIRSPLRHMALSRVPAALLLAGVNESSLAAAPGVVAFFSYSGPQPPNATGCHRYYVYVYAEDAALPPPQLNISAGGGRYNWNFLEWAASQNLTTLAVGMWRTQNFAAKVGPCDAAPTPTPAPTLAPTPAPDSGSASSPLALGLGLGIPLGLAALASLWLARAPLRRACGCGNGGSGVGEIVTDNLIKKRPGSSFLESSG